MASFEEAHQGMNDGVRRAEEHADSEWKEDALRAIEFVASRRADFISDDVWELTDLAQPREARAMGPVFMRARKLGIIEKTDRTRPSIRSHLSGKPVWRSLIY